MNKIKDDFQQKGNKTEEDREVFNAANWLDVPMPNEFDFTVSFMLSAELLDVLLIKTNLIFGRIIQQLCSNLLILTTLKF